MVKPRILFLTNEQNNAPEEDKLLVAFLKSHFDLVVSHPLDCLSHLHTVKGVIIRNIWPTHEYQEGWDAVKKCIRTSGLPVYNPLTFKGDVEGKDYLVVLYNKGYPVIPSIDRVDDLEKLPFAEYYWIKPKNSCDGIGAEKLTRDALLQKDPKGYIIQPFMEFEYEPSFYFVDNQFHHAIWEKHRLLYDDVYPYDSTPNDLKFAANFVQWTDLPYGTQRIDSIRTKDGGLLLTEIENLCPYLYLAEMNERKREDFLDAIKTSMLKVFTEQTTLCGENLIETDCEA
jgi:hypothetical protein